MRLEAVDFRPVPRHEFGSSGADFAAGRRQIITETGARRFKFGKFRIKQWGRNRIRQELKKRNISAYCIRMAMEEIEEQDYLLALDAILRKKEASLQEEDAYKRNNKLARYAISRGFEPELAWRAINDLFSQ